MNRSYKGFIYEWAFKSFNKWFKEYKTDKVYNEWRVCREIEDKIKYLLQEHLGWERRFKALYRFVEKQKQYIDDLEKIVHNMISLKLYLINEKCDRRFPK